MNVEDPIWTQTATYYLTKSGVDEPWVCEISPFQYRRMGKRTQAAYDRKRRGEFSASGACKKEFAGLVIEAFLSKEFQHTDQDVSADAKGIVLGHLASLRAEEVRARRKAAQLGNTLEISDLTVGDRVHHFSYGYGTIKKVNKKTVRFEIESSGKVLSCGGFSFQTYSHNDLEERID